MRNKLFRAVKVAAVALLALLTLFTSAAFGRPVIPTVNFRNAVKYAAGNNPFAVVAGDFNGDGKLDLAVANFADNNVSVLLNNGDGSFQPAVNYSTGTGPVSIAVGDFNGDGKLDLAVANGFDNNLSVLLGNGDGTFKPAANYNVGGAPSSVVVGDFNGDAIPDLAVTNGFDSDVSVLLGKGDGTFQAPVNYSVGARPDSIAVADFNGDGKLDLAVANFNDNTVSVRLGKGDGTFQPAVNYPVGTKPDSIAVGDLNGDGKPDLVVANQTDNNVSVILGNQIGDGTFQPAVNYATSAGTLPYSVAVGDFNGDGMVDLVVANLFTDDNGNNINVLMGGGNGTFEPALQYAAAGNSDSVTVGDVDGDGRPDLVVISDNGVGVLINNVLPTLPTTNGLSFSIPFLSSVGQGPIAAVAGDFNRDAQTDLVVANTNDATISVLKGNGDGTFRTAVNYAVSTRPYSIAAGDFNGDGRPDLVVTNLTTNNVSVLLNKGDATFSPSVSYPVGQAPSSVAVGDLNGDGVLDLVVVNNSDNNVSVLLGKGGGTFQGQQTFAVGSGPFAVKVGDLNGDGQLDLAVTNSSSGTVSVLLGQGDGTFQPAANYTVGSGPLALVVADFNGDAKPDLAAVNGNDNTVSVLLGKGDGTFQAAVTYSTGAGPASLAVTDINGDGKPDLATANTTDNTVSVLLGKGDGTFQPAVAQAGGGTFTRAIAVGDFNDDGKPDLASTNEISNNAGVLFNGGGAKPLLSASANSVVFGQSVTFTISEAALVIGTPTGTVQFQVGGGNLGAPVPLANGTATLITTLDVGNQTDVAALYSGDAHFWTNSAQTSVTVNRADTTVALSSSANPSDPGSSVTFTAALSVTLPGSGSPLGSITFVDGSTTLGIGKLNANSGVAAFTTSSLTAGSHSIAAVYGGNPNFAGSTSAVLTQTVNSPSFTLAASPTSATIRDGQSATYTLTVTPTGGFNSPVTLACAGLPKLATCTFAPSTLTPNGAPVTSTLTISTVGPSASLRTPSSDQRPLYALGLLWGTAATAGIVLVGGPRRKRYQGRRGRFIFVALLLCLITGAVMGCSSGSSSSTPKPSTPVGTSTITVTATAGNSPQTASLTLVVQ